MIYVVPENPVVPVIPVRVPVIPVVPVPVVPGFPNTLYIGLINDLLGYIRFNTIFVTYITGDIGAY